MFFAFHSLRPPPSPSPPEDLSYTRGLDTRGVDKQSRPSSNS